MQIEWSEQALNDLSAILRYVIEEFGLNVARRVQVEILNDVNMLADFPLMGMVIFDDKKTNRKYYSLTSKYQKIVYTINNAGLHIVTLWNTRCDNNSLTKLLSNND